MDILQINTHLVHGGGPQSYMQQVTELLRSRGHHVSHFGMEDVENKADADSQYFVSSLELLATAQSSSLSTKLNGAFRALWSTEASRKLKSMLDSRSFDIAHLHNIRYQLSPSILPELKRKGLAIVQTAHDYSLLCPRGCFYSEIDGICEKCRIHRYYNAPLARCIKGSLSRSLFAATELTVHRTMHVFERTVDMFIAPSQFMRDKYIEYGFHPNRVFFLPNAVNVSDNVPNLDQPTEEYYVYVGALRRLKGVYTLLEAASRLPKIRLVIVGGGEEYDHLKTSIAERGLTNVKLCGVLGGNTLRDMVAGAKFVVVPSEWYENCPMVVLEAFALGKPVIGARIGGIPELVEDQVTGLAFEPGNVDALVQKIDYLNARPSLIHAMGVEGHHRARQNHGFEKHYEGLLEGYRRAQEFNAKERDESTAI